MTNRIRQISVAVIALLMIGLAGEFAVTHSTRAQAYSYGPASYPPEPASNVSGVTTPYGYRQVYYAPVSVATAATHSVLVAGVPGKQIIVLGCELTNVVAGGTFTFETTTSNGVLGTYALPANGSFLVPLIVSGSICETLPGDGLDMTVTGSSNTVEGSIVYCIM